MLEFTFCVIEHLEEINSNFFSLNVTILNIFNVSNKLISWLFMDFIL